MTTSRPARPLVASAPFAAIALLAGIAVAQTPRPDSTLIVRDATPPRVPPTLDAVVIRDLPKVPEIVPVTGRHIERKVSNAPTVEEPPRIVTGTPTYPKQPIPIDVVRSWIQARHPNVIAGDSHVNAVTIVVDENNDFLASATDSIQNERVGKTPSILVRGRLMADSVQVALPPRPEPVFIVDGVRVDNPSQLDTIPIESVDVIKGKAAAAEYGPDAENGAIIIHSMRPNEAQLQGLGVSSDNIKEMTELRLSPGVIGPNRLYVAILQLKKH